MNISVRRRGISLLASAALMAGGALAAGAGSAAAATPDAGPRVVSPHAVSTWDVYYNSTYRGTFQWSADPSGSNPGDAMRVTDDAADGFGIEADLDTGSSIRVATTAGHDSPYTSAWATGDLPEGKQYTVYIYLVSGGQYYLASTTTVTS
ncbi:hypothetical protein [Actinacidiphila bryophytorum]|uniref:Uncharacterized protein n=1 Tax=Actinacidiphila bryophytorum TaxID=1436133 RepID=A0A9W4H470_9ACTN|nr:hypothetical protein [Actinacidiphila bryophytorum]MBM9435925.1 hypothetical protein [Actinacidiphila bryophytorum]MBN6541512.1 hypothetical protein [Actinacidiphila bryophytorum]CAG7649533.1 conserved exported hypothetical protein [Actinacidiphila bryophytorum]